MGSPTGGDRPQARATTDMVAVLQARVEGAQTGDTVLFMGARFLIANDTGIMPLLMFAASADAGVDSTDMAGLAAMYAMVKDCIADDAEWRRFVRHSVLTKAKADDLMAVVNQTVEILAARPTVPPGESSPGRDATSDTSKANTSAPLAAGLRVPDDVSELMSLDDLVARSTD